MFKKFFTAAVVLATVSPPPATAGDADWPQWRGPNRDGHAAPQSLLQQWPDGGPELAWQFADAGTGYSASAIVDDRLFTLGSDDANCFAICLDSATGKPVWRTSFSRSGVSGDYNQGWGGGPRSTPTVDGDQVFVMSDVGIVAALDRDTGELRWSVDLVEIMGGNIPAWGYSESVLVDGDTVLCTPGGATFIVGLDRSTGEQIWQSRDVNEPAHYSSIVRGAAGGVSYYAQASKSGLFGFRVNDGARLFSNEATGNRVAVIPTPVVLQDGLYHTSDYGAGNVRLKLTDTGDDSIAAEQVYHMTDKTMQNHHGGVVLVDGVIYGFANVNGGVWLAQDVETGEVLWEERLGRNKSGSIAFADGHLYCYNDKDGECYLVEPNRSGWKPLGSVTLPRQTKLPRDRGAIWAHPVIANRLLIIRDQDLLFAFEISR